MAAVARGRDKVAAMVLRMTRFPLRCMPGQPGRRGCGGPASAGFADHAAGNGFAAIVSNAYRGGGGLTTRLRPATAVVAGHSWTGAGYGRLTGRIALITWWNAAGGLDCEHLPPERCAMARMSSAYRP